MKIGKAFISLKILSLQRNGQFADQMKQMVGYTNKDSIWGIGRTMQDPKRLDLDEWKGQNLLGYTLMMVRDKL